MDNKGEKISFIFNHIFGILRGIALFFIPLMFSRLVQSLSNDTDAVIFYFYMVFIFSFLNVFFNYVNTYFNEYLRWILSVKLKSVYYEKVFNKSYAWHIQNNSGYFLASLNDVAKLLDDWIIKISNDYLPNFTASFLFVIYTYLKSPIMGLYFTVGSLIITLYLYIAYKRRLQLVKGRIKAKNSYEKSFTDFLYNIRNVKKTNLIKFVMKVLENKYCIYADKSKLQRHYIAHSYFISRIAVLLLFMFPIGYFIYQYIKTGNGLNIIVMIVSSRSSFENIIRDVKSCIENVLNNKSHIDNLSNVLKDETDTSQISSLHKKNIKHWKKFTFKDVSFTYYKKHSRFKSFVPDLEIVRGDHIAITGKSGEGKSTFLNLFTRQLNFESGQAFVDNIPYPQISESFFNSQITYISQDVELFDMSLYDNIVLGKRISKEKLYKVLEGCCLENLIARMNGNLDTPIGEKGIKVSGGERQRINLARGLLLDRDILVLDEITANLDPVTTERIWEYIFKEYREKTIIAISHEKGLLQHTNKVVRFRNGKGKLNK
ncbi:ABC transporter ATP-binding protein [bacterium]|nr:ABC transporter ATP-binding protein [bacterium]